MGFGEGTGGEASEDGFGEVCEVSSEGDSIEGIDGEGVFGGVVMGVEGRCLGLSGVLWFGI